MTDISASGCIVFHIPWFLDCVSLIQSHFRNSFSRLSLSTHQSWRKTKTLILTTTNNLRGKVNIIALLICSSYYNFFLVAISVDSLNLFSISFFAREDVYSMYSPFGYALQHPLQHQYNQQSLPQIPHPYMYYGSTMRSSLQMMAPPFAPSPAHAARTS